MRYLQIPARPGADAPRVQHLTPCPQMCAAQGGLNPKGPMPLSVLGDRLARYAAQYRTLHLFANQSTRLLFLSQYAAGMGAVGIAGVLDLAVHKVFVASVGGCHGVLGQAVGSFNQSTAEPLGLVQAVLEDRCAHGGAGAVGAVGPQLCAWRARHWMQAQSSPQQAHGRPGSYVLCDGSLFGQGHTYYVMGHCLARVICIV